MRIPSSICDINVELQDTMKIEDEGLEALTKIAGRPKAREKFGKFNSVYIEAFDPKKGV